MQVVSLINEKLRFDVVFKIEPATCNLLFIEKFSNFAS